MFDKWATLIVVAIFTTLLLVPLALVKYLEHDATTQKTRANMLRSLVQQYDAEMYRMNTDLKGFLYDSKSLTRENIRLLRANNETSIALLREHRQAIERDVPIPDEESGCVLVRATRKFLFPTR